MTTTSERAKAIAASAAIATVAAAGAWAAYQSADETAALKTQTEALQYRCGEWLDASGTRSHGCKKMKAVEVAAGKADGLITKDCGTIAERGKKCPDIFPKKERCAMCDYGLCRYGKHGEKDCDPDAVGCKPWPCVVMYGDAPEQVAEEKTE